MRSLLRMCAVLGALALGLAALVIGFPPRAPQIGGVAGAPGGEPIAGPIDRGDSIGTWKPDPGLRFQVQLGGDVEGTLGATVYDLDPYGTPAQTVAELRSTGAKTMCHLDVGVADPTVPDAGRFAADLLGAVVADGRGHAGRWLDIRAWDRIAPILTDRLRLCRTKGFQAVDADHGDGYTHATGFPLTAGDQLAFDRNVAALAHRLRLAVGVRTTVALALRLRPSVDFAITQGCVDAGTCPDYLAFIDADKEVFDLEPATPARVCALARAYGFAASRVAAAPDAPAIPCD